MPAFDVDDEGGGMIGEIYRRNINLAITEKVRKTRAVASQFEEWVLVLVDTITPEISWHEELGTFSPALGHFNSLIVIDHNGLLLYRSAAPTAI